MIKANQNNNSEVVYVPEDLKRLVGSLDSSTRLRERKADELRREVTKGRKHEDLLASTQREIARSMANAKKLQEELNAMPEIDFGPDSVKALIERVGKLAWVKKATLNGTVLTLITEPGVLKTDFYDRLVVGNGERCTELLPEVANLPLPSYEIMINLGNMGGSWSGSSALQMRIADRAEVQFFGAEDGDWVQEIRPHWACNNNQGEYGTLCLGEYDGVLFAAAEKGLIEFLSELAIYLQKSGWSSAYINKMAWACLLGFGPYTEHLIRHFGPGESIDAIQQLNRTRLPDFLKRNNITTNQYQYGSFGTSEEEEEPYCDACECEYDGDDESCACDCHD